MGFDFLLKSADIVAGSAAPEIVTGACVPFGDIVFGGVKAKPTLNSGVDLIYYP